MKIEIVSMFTLRPVRKSHISVWLIPPVLPAIVVLAGLHISQFGLFLQSCLPLLFLQGFTYLSLAYSSSPACHCCSCRTSHISVWLIPPVLPAIVVLAELHISQFGLLLQSCLPLLFLQGFTYLSLAYSSSPACHCCSCRASHISVWLIPPVLPAIVVLAGLHISQFGLFLQSCLPLLFLQGFTYLSLAYSSSPACHCCSCRASHISVWLIPPVLPAIVVLAGLRRACLFRNRDRFLTFIPLRILSRSGDSDAARSSGMTLDRSEDFPS